MSIKSLESARAYISVTPSFSERVSHRISEIASRVMAPLIAFHNLIRPINPVTQSREFRLIPSSVERFIGRMAYAPLLAKSGGKILETDFENGRYATLVREVGERLAAKCPRKDLEFEFSLVDSNVDNAWCLPGGKIAINLGLVKHMESDVNNYGMEGNFTLSEKVAAVLSHEIIHAAARHGGRKIEFSLFLTSALYAVKYVLSYFVLKSYDKEIAASQKDPLRLAQLKVSRDRAVENTGTILNPIIKWTRAGLNLCGSRRHELEADKFGMHLLASIGEEAPFSDTTPRSAIWLMHFFAEHHSSKTGRGWLDWAMGFFHTHPTPEERLSVNLDTWQTLMQDSIEKKRFLARG